MHNSTRTRRVLGSRRGLAVRLAAAAGGLLSLSVAIVLAGCSILGAGPNARISVAVDVVYVDENVLFDASASDGSIVNYAWDFGNGLTGAGQQVTISFTTPGTYEAQLQVTDVDGRSDEASVLITVYVRSGTRLFYEDFSDGKDSLGNWPLDPTWASAEDSGIEAIEHGPGYVLYIHSGADRWHRRYATLLLPPVRDGQHVVFSAQVMTLQTQRSHTFSFTPLRKSIESPVGSLPYFEFTSDGEGSFMREPTPFSKGSWQQVPFLPDVYHWHNYVLVYSPDSYELWIDGILLTEGPVGVDFVEGGTWYVLLGEESSTEACSAYFDDIEVSIEE